jgi:type II secretory pathway pseudopilin PulG
LAAIIFPSIGAARKSANRAKTKVQFNQWAAAIESFRSEYGYYPTLSAFDLVNGGASPTLTGDHLFHDILAGKKRNGDALGSAAAAQNRKRIAFYTFSDAELTPGNSDNPYLIRNAFESLSMAVVVDRNLDGKIDASDCNSGGFPGVATPDGALITPTSGTTSADIPSGGVRAGVIFYCADPNATSSDPQFIFSWK